MVKDVLFFRLLLNCVVSLSVDTEIAGFNANQIVTIVPDHKKYILIKFKKY